MGPLAIINIVGAGNGIIVAMALTMRKKGPVATNRILACLVSGLMLNW